MAEAWTPPSAPVNACRFFVCRGTSPILKSSSSDISKSIGTRAVVRAARMGRRRIVLISALVWLWIEILPRFMIMVRVDFFN
jgi:hypothetical protein